MLLLFFVFCVDFSTLPRTTTTSEVIETQLKLSSQKWKAKCKIGKHQQQLWQDNDVSLIYKYPRQFPYPLSLSLSMSSLSSDIFIV